MIAGGGITCRSVHRTAMLQFGLALPLLLFTCSASHVRASSADTLRVLELLQQARTPSNNSILGFVHDSTLSAQALELAERIGWERGIFKGHMWSLISISDRGFRASPEEWYRHARGATQRRKWASIDEIVLLYRTIGRANALFQIPDTAALYIDTAQWAAERSGDKRLLALTTYTRAHSLRIAERWGEAFRAVLASNALADELNDPLIRSASFNLSGMIRGRLGDLEGAVKDFTASLALADSMGINALRLQNHNNWAYVMEVKGHWREALEQYRALYQVTTSSGDELEFLPQVETGIGYMLVHLDSLDQAEAILGRLRSTKVMVGDPYEQWHNNAWALLQLRRGRFREAVASAHTAFVTEQSDENDVVKRDASRILSEAYKALNEPGEALKWTEVAHQWEDSVFYRQQANDALRVEMDRELASRVLQDSLAHAREIYRAELASQQRLSQERNRRNILLITAASILLLSILLWRRLRDTRHAKRAIEMEHARSEELLLNILPEEVAEELKAKGEAEAKLISDVTVLFTDFKGFTAMSEQLTPKELVADIHECFSAFDLIMEKHGIEKIKTIGDAYMAAGGLPTPNNTHALDVVKAALEIRDFIAEGKAQKIANGLPYFEIRIGIHTGPVVAGIVGVKKFAYDIWGDTVNTASRMESSGEVGEVNISEATYALVKDEAGLLFTPRGKVQAKGKGEMEMYFVHRSPERAQ